MAATRLIALHKNKGKSVAACLKSRTDYVQNPDKTEQGELVSSYECSPLTVDEEFMLSKRQYELATGRRQKSDVIAYQIRQSFKPGEITAEEANKVGYELAMRFTKGKYGRKDLLRIPADNRGCVGWQARFIPCICPAWHDALCGVVSRRVQRGTAGSCAWQRPSHGDLPCWQG